MRCLLTGVLAFSLMAVGGVTSQVHAAKGNKPKPTPEEAFKKRDKDNNGTISADEFIGKKAGDKAAAAKKAFQKKDKDNSGSLTFDEFKGKGKGKGKKNKKA